MKIWFEKTVKFGFTYLKCKPNLFRESTIRQIKLGFFWIVLENK